jgi:hypothetical protein
MCILQPLLIISFYKSSFLKLFQKYSSLMNEVYAQRVLHLRQTCGNSSCTNMNLSAFCITECSSAKPRSLRSVNLLKTGFVFSILLLRKMLLNNLHMPSVYYTYDKRVVTVHTIFSEILRTEMLCVTFI